MGRLGPAPLLRRFLREKSGAAGGSPEAPVSLLERLDARLVHGCTGLLLCCPVTTREKGHLFEVAVSEASGTRGVALSAQVPAGLSST